MKTSSIIFIAFALLLSACASHTKKILVFGNNNVAINEDTKTITQKDTTGHVDKEILYSTGDKVELNIKSPGGETKIDIPDDGYYIVNLKAKDTIIGGYQKFSTPGEANRVMTQDELKHNIDSLQQMVENKNINAASRTFFILPNTSAKITSNTDAFIVGPYHRMTSIAKEGDKDPEVYRFYSIKEVRETIEKLTALTK